MKTQGKYDAVCCEALRLREPVARVMRRTGFSEREIRSAQGMLPSIRNRVAPEDERAWMMRKRLCYLRGRRNALERLETGKSRSEAGDLQMIEAYDRALRSLQLAKHEPKEALGVIVDLST